MAIMLTGISVSGLIEGRSGEPPSECMIATVCSTSCVSLCVYVRSGMCVLSKDDSLVRALK